MANQRDTGSIKIGKEENAPTPEEVAKKKRNARIRYILNISIVLIVTVVSIFITFWGNVDTIIADLSKCDWRWLLAIVGVMAFSMLIRSFVLFCFARLFTKHYNFGSAMACDQIGQFYNAVTPGASGGQIMQAYTYKKQGVPISNAVSALAMYSIMFQIVLIVYNIFSFAFKFDAIMSIDVAEITVAGTTLHLPILVLTIIGFLLNLGIILLVLMMGYWHSFHNFIMGPCISLLAKMHILKNPDKNRENLRVGVENFKIEFRRLMTNIPLTILVAVAFTIYMTLKFSIPYFCGLALGSEHVQSGYFWDSVFLGNYHQMVTGLIPIPGSAGVSEYFFYILFLNKSDPSAGFFYKDFGEATLAECESMTKAALVIWRSMTFIIPIVCAGFVTAFYRASPQKDVDARGEYANRGTFVNLQRETYVMRKEEVETLIETTRLSRQAIRERLLKKKSKPKKSTTKKETSSKTIQSKGYTEMDIEDDA